MMVKRREKRGGETTRGGPSALAARPRPGPPPLRERLSTHARSGPALHPSGFVQALSSIVKSLNMFTGCELSGRARCLAAPIEACGISYSMERGSYF